MLRQDDAQKAKLVEVGWLYGREYGGHLGACVIMSCIANRQRLGWGSWFEIIAGIPAKAATTEQPTGIPSVWEPNYARLLHEVENIYDGSKDYANGACYWVDTAKPISNEWFQEKILNEQQSHPSVGSMNSLMWFR